MSQEVAIVTGANRGIGFEVSHQLAQKGIHVILTSRNLTKGATAAERLQAEGLNVRYHLLDVTDQASIQRLREFVEQEHGRLDILVNNAGVYIDDRHRLLEVDPDILQQTINTNAYGPLWLTQAFVPLMKQHGYGRIVNVSSGIGELSSLGSSWPAYRLSKILLNLQTRIIADELQGTNILINAMCPGWVRTDMGGAAAPRSVEEGADTAVWLATLTDGGPQGGYFRDRQPIEW
jgi:NAD(P)-dependent dehydrogenase (short-subunit alcohol dehydrogenase family)